MMEIHKATTTSEVMEAFLTEVVGAAASAVKRLRDIRGNEDNAVLDLVREAGGWQGGVAPVPAARGRGTTTGEYYRRQASVLLHLQASGGRMEMADFVALCRRAGYRGQGYGQFYRADGLCEVLNGVNGVKVVKITDAGSDRIEVAQEYMRRNGLPEVAAA